MKLRSVLAVKRLILIGIGFTAGFVTLLTIRAVAYNPPFVHHHANFALYINGQRDEFKSFTFYEEIQACSDVSSNPKSRVHMHEQKAGLVHVHDAGVTWGHFFANLGYGLTDKVLQTDAGIFQTTDQSKVSFILNGKPIDTIANRVIESKDVLLINVGNEDNAELDKRFTAIPRTADEANHKQDPASCAGAYEITLGERLRYAIGIDSKPPEQTRSDDHAH